MIIHVKICNFWAIWG